MAEQNGDNYLTHTSGIKSWLLTLDHKRIGVMYLVSVLGSFLLGGVFALLVRTELMFPNYDAVTGRIQRALLAGHVQPPVQRSTGR